MNALIEAAEEYIKAAETYRCSVDPSVEREITMIIARERLRDQIKLVREVAAPARAQLPTIEEVSGLIDFGGHSTKEILDDLRGAATARAHQDEKEEMPLARSATPERGDPQPAAAPDAGEQQDCAGTKCANCGHPRNLHFGGCNDWESPPCKCEGFTTNITDGQTPLRKALTDLLHQSESYVNLSRARGFDLRPEAADAVRNAIAAAKLILDAK